MVMQSMIFAALLIGNVCCGGFGGFCNENYDPRTLTRSAECGYIQDDDVDELTDNIGNCAAYRCSCDADCCDGNSCYFGCQDGPGQQLIMPHIEFTDIEDECRALAAETFGDVDTVADCSLSSCGICVAEYCVEIDVHVEKLTTSVTGMCERDWHEPDTDCVAGASEEPFGDLPSTATITSAGPNCNLDGLSCVKNLKGRCGHPRPPIFDDEKLLHVAGDCFHPCGWPLVDQCCDDHPHGLIVTPLNGNTGFQNLCVPGDSSVRILRGSCASQKHKPECHKYDHDDFYYGGNLPEPDALLRVNAKGVPEWFCQENACNTPLSYDVRDCTGSGVKCMAFADMTGMAIGTCEISNAGYDLYTCDGNSYSEYSCPKEATYDPPVFHNTEPTYTSQPNAKKDDSEKEQSYEPVYYDDSSKATTPVVMLAVGSAIIHVLF